MKFKEFKIWWNSAVDLIVSEMRKIGSEKGDKKRD